MPLFLLFIIYVTLNRQQWDTWELQWLIFEDAGDANYEIRIDKGEQLVIVCDFPPWTWTPAIHISGSNGPEFLPCAFISGITIFVATKASLSLPVKAAWYRFLDLDQIV